ncbi:MAG: DUF4386 domain-containing protein [Anaerolineae bacterium]|jgi:hypothetical protein
MNVKRISRISGVLYLTTVPAFLVSNLLLKGQLVNAPDIAGTLGRVADNVLRYRLAVAIDFLGMVAVMALVFSLYIILKPFNPYLALLALGWRIGEVVLQAGAKVPDYLLLTLSQSGGEMAELVPLGQMLLTGSTQAVWLSFVFLSAGSVVNNFLFYKSKGIPRVLAVYGLISTGLYGLGSMAALVVDLSEGLIQGMLLPLVLFELMLGLYLAIAGMREATS